MKIGMIGSGNVVGIRDVLFSSRHPEELNDFFKIN